MKNYKLLLLIYNLNTVCTCIGRAGGTFTYTETIYFLCTFEGLMGFNLAHFKVT